ncbi:hypothetical protein [Paenibacillus xylanexedens]|uniref:hypothetical protein n=1 Tax=Paenibacillus xylanexedens TaxID=528191 RepID=UPI003D058209
MAMYIQYDEFLLLELFESDPISIADEEAGIFMYTKMDNVGFKLMLTISIYEKQCNLSLVHDQYSIPVFECKLDNVEELCTTTQGLTIRRPTSTNVIVTFKPNFSIQINNL